MIFVTVGTGEFDNLVREIDSLIGEGKIKDRVVVQIGKGKYKPNNCQYFGFAPDLSKYYKKADLVISHGGPGTVFEILHEGKKFIAVPNRDRTDPGHQVEFLKGLSNESKALLYCDDYRDIGHSVEKAKKYKFVRYKSPKCNIHEHITRYLISNVVCLRFNDQLNR